MKKIGIIGTRKRDTLTDFSLVEKKFFELYEDGDQIVSGGCPKGGDRFAERIAKSHFVPIMIFYPNWAEDGKGAAFIRNGLIAKESDIIIACVSGPHVGIKNILIRKFGGTEDTLKKFAKRDFRLQATQSIYLV